MTEQSVGTRVAAIREQIRRACELSRRPSDSVHLIGASKRQPLSKIEEAIAAGLYDLGENRVQEADDKQTALEARSASAAKVRWHFFGPLQSNKARRAGALFDSIHSLERFKIAKILDQQAGLLGKKLEIFIQINVGGEQRKSGIRDPRLDGRPASGLIPTLQPYRDFENLQIAGLMAIPPFEKNPKDARKWFRKLRELRDAIGDADVFPGFIGYLSMGMSHDFQVAIEEGATHVRIGTALFGVRPESIAT